MQGTQYATKRSILCRGAFCGPTVHRICTRMVVNLCTCSVHNVDKGVPVIISPLLVEYLLRDTDMGHKYCSCRESGLCACNIYLVN